MLSHDHPVIRYWGAIGCIVQAEKASAATNQLRKLLDDDTEAVRVAAAQALYVSGEKEAGFDGLVAILKGTKDPVVALEALNATQALGVMKKVPKDVWDKASKVGGYSQRMAKDPADPNLQAEVFETLKSIP